MPNANAITVSRYIRLLVVGVVGAAVATICVSAATVGFQPTVLQLHRSVSSVESAAYCHTPLLLSFVAPPSSLAEEQVWRLFLDLYGRSPRGDRLPLGVSPRTLWPLLEGNEAESLFDRVVNGSAYDPGDPEYALTVHDFLLKNAKPVLIQARAFPPNVHTVPLQTLYDTDEPRNGWQQFCARSGVAAYITLSRVGFNVTGTRALIYVQFSCGPLCGHAGYYTLAKDARGWHVVQEHIAWVS
jgi:hypothetical protein